MKMLKKCIMGLLLILSLLIVLAIAFSLKLAFDSRNMEVEIGVENNRLSKCPSSPNCVSSDEISNDSHYISPITDPEGSKWINLLEKVSMIEGAQLQFSDDEYYHFTFTTKLMRYTDDIEFHYRPSQNEIAVRSASRVGQGDMNANRNRIELIRNSL